MTTYGRHKSILQNAELKVQQMMQPVEHQMGEEVVREMVSEIRRLLITILVHYKLVWRQEDLQTY